MSDSTYSETKDNPAKSKNYYWNQTFSTISLSSASNEIITFQIIIEKTDKDLSGIWLECSDLTGLDQHIISADNFELFREWYVNNNGIWYPEVLVSFDLKQDWKHFSIPDPNVLKFSNNNQALWVDLFIPHETPADKYLGTITLYGNEFSPIELSVDLTVWDFTLPNKQNYDYEMNIYGGLEKHFDGQSKISKNKTNYLEFEENTYRLCHKNRVTLLIMPYTQSGSPSTYVKDSMRPTISGSGENIQVIFWENWDERFGKYFEGTAFSDLYRSRTPIAHFTLPFNHTWPSDWSNFVSGAGARPYWSKNPTYEAEIIAVSKEFEKHCNEKSWNETLFHIYYNEKKSWGYLPWNLDEPINVIHYDALRYYSQIMHSGFNNTLRSFGDLGDADKEVSFPQPDSAKFLYRMDVGRQNQIHGYLNGWIDLWNVGGWQADGNHNYILSELKERMARGDHFMVYAPNTFPIEDYNLDLLWQAWNDWKRHATGHEIWMTNDWPSGITSDWSRVFSNYGGKCTYYYPGSNLGLNQPLPSIRMKIIRHAVQDWEYLYYLTQLNGGNRLFADNIVTGLMDAEDISFEAETSQYSLSEESFMNARKQVAEEIENVISVVRGFSYPDNSIPMDFYLVRNYPNPFNSATIIEFNVPGRGSIVNVELKIFNLKGQAVRTLLRSEVEAGLHMVKWDGCNDYGNSVGSGIYYCCLKADRNVFTRKIVLLR